MTDPPCPLEDDVPRGKIHRPASFEGEDTTLAGEDEESRYSAEVRPVNREWSRWVPHRASAELGMVDWGK